MIYASRGLAVDWWGRGLIKKRKGVWVSAVRGVLIIYLAKRLAGYYGLLDRLSES